MSAYLSTRSIARGVFVVGVTCVMHGALAQAPASSADDEAVLVTASRTPENLNDTLWSSTVFTREDIESRQPNSVLELLADVAGIDVGNNGGLGQLSSVFIRGGESDHTLLLIDGVRVASATSGAPAFEQLPISEIERIEIVRGPRSTLYGTDAIGGVIQIFTRRAPQSGLSGGAEVSGGSHDTRKFGASLGARGDRAWVSLGAESFDTNGFNACAIEAGVVFRGCFASEPDADGFRNNSGTLAAGYAFNDAWSVQLNSLIADGRTEFDGSVFTGNVAEFDQRVFAVSLDGTLGAGWHTRVTLGRNEDLLDNFWEGNLVDSYDTRRDTAAVQIDGSINDALRLIAGVEHQRDEIESSVDYAADSRHTTGVFSELHAKLGAWSALAGARYEDNEQFGSHVTGNVGLGRALSHGLRLTGTWGTAFHAPTFNDLYYPFGSGNPDLEPEKSRSFEIGLSGRAGSVSLPLDWSLQVFQTDVRQFISLDDFFVPQNIDDVRIRGAELQGSWRTEKWRVGGQITRLDPINRTDGGLQLRRRAKESASLELRRIWPSFSIGTVARYQGRRFDDGANLAPLGGYVTVDLMASQSIGSAFEVQARVANVLDRDYQTAAYYLQDGRNYSVTLRYRFDTGR